MKRAPVHWWQRKAGIWPAFLRLAFLAVALIAVLHGTFPVEATGAMNLAPVASTGKVPCSTAIRATARKARRRKAGQIPALRCHQCTGARFISYGYSSRSEERRVGKEG